MDSLSSESKGEVIGQGLKGPTNGIVNSEEVEDVVDTLIPSYKVVLKKIPMAIFLGKEKKSSF